MFRARRPYALEQGDGNGANHARGLRRRLRQAQVPVAHDLAVDARQQLAGVRELLLGGAQFGYPGHDRVPRPVVGEDHAQVSTLPGGLRQQRLEGIERRAPAGCLRGFERLLMLRDRLGPHAALHPDQAEPVRRQIDADLVMP